MKTILCGLLLISSFSLFAAPLDNLLGVYKAKDRDGTAVVTKKQVKDATLFEPATFQYKVEIFRKKHNIDRTVVLKTGADGKSLNASVSDDCDYPDCHAFNSFDVEVKKVGAVSQVLFDYDGYDTEDGSDVATEFSGSAIFIKK